MPTSKTLEITDDSGFIGIVNADTYQSFVSEDWELAQLFNHFVNEMNKDHLILWSTGAENIWAVAFVDKPSHRKAFREFQKTIEVTDGKIFLTNYEDLTMAAQYSYQQIPAKHNADLHIQLDNGKYNLKIRQLFDPQDYDDDSELHFEIVIQLETNSSVQKVDKVMWWEQ